MATETMNFEGYEYGLAGIDGEIIQIGKLEVLSRDLREGEAIVFRASYVTDWRPSTFRADG